MKGITGGSTVAMAGEARAATASRAAMSLPSWVAALFVLAVAVLLYSQFGEDDTLSRDEALYAYAGQQFAHGVPFYSALFEQKTPIAAILAGFGAVAGRALGANDLHAMRFVFFVFACLTVVGVYLLAVQLWGSKLAGLISAAAFVAFRGFAIDALGGPDAKTPGICFAVLSMVLLVRRRWFWGAFAGSLAFLVWQPLVVYAALSVALAAVVQGEDRRRRRVGRALAGVAIPIAAISLYLWLTGAFGRFIDAAFNFPLTGLQRGPETLSHRLTTIATTVDHSYGPVGDVLVFGGLILLIALIAGRFARARPRLTGWVNDPLCAVVAASFVPLAVFTASDFQGYPDVFPLLPYAAIGFGGAFAVATRRVRAGWLRTAAFALPLAAAAALVGWSWHDYGSPGPSGENLLAQRAKAAELNRILGRDSTLYALQDPRPLVLTKRRNPSRYILVSDGIAEWIVSHTRGGFDGWKASIAASHPDVVVLGRGWKGPYADAMRWWLHTNYRSAYVSDWHVYVTPAVAKRAADAGVVLSPRPEAELQPSSVAARAIDGCSTSIASSSSRC